MIHVTRSVSASLTALLAFLVTGCASYTTPGRGADLKAIAAQADPGIREALARKPLASFPAAIAVARLASPGYHSDTAVAYGTGRYAIITTRDVEKTEQFDRLAHLPQVAGVAPVSRLLLPAELRSDRDLRAAAAQLHADMLLIYTLDTTFYTSDMATPLTVVSLGLSPNQQTRVVTTASALLVDTRNGYVYGAAEATEQRKQFASAWTTNSAVDQSRLKTETAAFDKLVGELEKTWGGVVQQYARPAAAATAR